MARFSLNISHHHFIAKSSKPTKPGQCLTDHQLELSEAICKQFLPEFLEASKSQNPMFKYWWKKALGPEGWCECCSVMRAGGKWETVKEGCPWWLTLEFETLKFVLSSSVSSPEPYHQRGPRILKNFKNWNKIQIKIILSLLYFKSNIPASKNNRSMETSKDTATELTGNLGRKCHSWHSLPKLKVASIARIKSSLKVWIQERDRRLKL